MPIRINLLAEAKVAEEMRRHDPVKRVIFLGALLVALMLVWSSSLLLEGMLAKKAMTDRRTQIELSTNDYQCVLINQQKIAEARQKLDALNKLANNRFLQGNLLNALQQVHVEGVQLTRVAVNQTYVNQEPKKSAKGAPGPGTVVEKIVVVVEAQDFSANPGEQVNKMKDALANYPYFKAALNRTNGVQLANLSAPQSVGEGKTAVSFTLNCNFPEVSR